MLNEKEDLFQEIRSSFMVPIFFLYYPPTAASRFMITIEFLFSLIL